MKIHIYVWLNLRIRWWLDGILIYGELTQVQFTIFPKKKKKFNTLTDSLNALVILLTLKVISIGIN